MATAKQFLLSIESPDLRASILRGLSETHSGYVTATRPDGSRLNCRDNVWLVAKPYVFGRLFDPVMSMSASDLNEISEVIGSFPTSANGYIPDSIGVYEYGKSIFDEFYDSLPVERQGSEKCLRCRGDGYVVETDCNGEAGIFPCYCTL